METRVSVHTQSKTNRHLHLCQGVGFVPGARTISDQRLSGDHAGEHAKCFVLTFSKTSTVTNFRCLRPADFFERSSVSVNSTRVPSRFDRHGFQKKKFTGPQRQKERKAALQVGSKSIELVTHRRLHSSFDSRVVLVEHAAVHTPHLRDRRRWSMPSDCSNFEDEERAALMYAELLRCTRYTRRAALTKGKPQESGNPHQVSQSAGQLFLVNARPFPEQSSSIATCRVGSI